MKCRVINVHSLWWWYNYLHCYFQWHMDTYYGWCPSCSNVVCRWKWNLMLQHPSLSEIKSQLTSSGPDENHKKKSIVVTKWGSYMEYCSNVTPLLTKSGHFVKISRIKFIQADGILVRSTNPFDFTIKACTYVHIGYE